MSQAVGQVSWREGRKNGRNDHMAKFTPPTLDVGRTGLRRNQPSASLEELRCGKKAWGEPD